MRITSRVLSQQVALRVTEANMASCKCKREHLKALRRCLHVQARTATSHKVKIAGPSGSISRYQMCVCAVCSAGHVGGKLLTCFLPGLLWAGVTGSSTLGMGEPTDLLLPVCIVGAGLAACLEAGAPGDAFPLPCVPHSVSHIHSRSAALKLPRSHLHRGNHQVPAPP